MHLRELAESLCRQKDTLDINNTCKKIEETVHNKKGIFHNVNYYSARAIHALGVPKDFFTAFFAASRVSGWVAHTLEQYVDSVLIHPTSEYNGEYGRNFVPIRERN